MRVTPPPAEAVAAPDGTAVLSFRSKPYLIRMRTERIVTPRATVRPDATPAQRDAWAANLTAKINILRDRLASGGTR